MNRNVTGFIKDKKSRYGLGGYGDRPQHTHRDTEKSCEKSTVPFSVAFGDDDVNSGAGITQQVEIDVGTLDGVIFTEAGRDRFDIRRGERLALGDYAGEYRPLEIALRFSEGAPVDPDLRISRRKHFFGER